MPTRIFDYAVEPLADETKVEVFGAIDLRGDKVLLVREVRQPRARKMRCCPSNRPGQLVDEAVSDLMALNIDGDGASELVLGTLEERSTPSTGPRESEGAKRPQPSKPPRYFAGSARTASAADSEQIQ